MTGSIYNSPILSGQVAAGINRLGSGASPSGNQPLGRNEPVAGQNYLGGISGNGGTFSSGETLADQQQLQSLSQLGSLGNNFTVSDLVSHGMISASMGSFIANLNALVGGVMGSNGESLSNWLSDLINRAKANHHWIGGDNSGAGNVGGMSSQTASASGGSGSGSRSASGSNGTSKSNPFTGTPKLESLGVGGGNSEGPYRLDTPAAENFKKANAEFKAKYGHDITVNSAYRSPSYNAGIGGANNSNHTHGRAMDIRYGDVDKAKPILEKYGFKQLGGTYNNPVSGPTDERNHFDFVG